MKIERSSSGSQVSGGSLSSRQRYLGDYKRRCYGGGTGTGAIAGDAGAGTDDQESSGMAS